MATVAVSQVKPGDKILQDVLTPLGSVLFYKGKVLMQRELEILQAFLVPTVVIDAPDKREEDEKAENKSAAHNNGTRNMLVEEYERTVALLKKVFSQSISELHFPILDTRMQLEKLLKYIDEYKILTFQPNSIQENDYIFHKSVMSSMSCYMLAQWNGMPRKDWMQVALAGLLHDIGNAKVDQGILSKPKKLTAEEVEEMKRHTVHGYQLLKNVAAINEGVKLAALQHHERIDGSGYPFGVASDKIHPYARIVAIADIYNAMTMKRTYRAANSPYLVLEQIQQDSFGKLDPHYVQTFIEKVTQFHNGTIVRLSDDRAGEIIFSDRSYPTRPWVSVNGSVVNLTVERNLYIQEIISKGN